MSLIIEFTIIAFIILFILLFLYIMLIKILKKKDMKKEYSKSDIRMYLYNTNGLEIRIPYLVWQVNKKKFIKKKYNTKIDFDEKTYTVLATPTSKQYIQTYDEILPLFCYRDYIAVVELCKTEISHISNNTSIIGNNNTININNTLVGDITQNVNRLLEQDIDENDKALLELFKYKLQDDSADKPFKKKIIKTLEKYTPYISLATATINMIKSILP